MISLTDHDSRCGRSEVVIIYPETINQVLIMFNTGDGPVAPSPHFFWNRFDQPGTNLRLLSDQQNACGTSQSQWAFPGEVAGCDGFYG